MVCLLIPQNFDSVKPGDTAGGTLSVNAGLLARQRLFGGNGQGSCDFKGVLLADICNQGHLILDGVDVGITLWPNKNEFKIMSNVACKIVIDMFTWMYVKYRLINIACQVIKLV